MAVADRLNTALFELDLAVFFGATLATGYVNLILGQYQTIRPFFPTDATLWFTYTGDTVETGVVFIVLYLIFAPIIYQIEQKISKQTPHITPRRAKLTALRFAFGMWTSTMIGVLVVELGKGYVGRLRPSFARACLDALPDAPLPAYLSDGACPTAQRHMLHDMRRSFPSGHAALAVGGAMYAQLYVVYALRRVQLTGVRGCVAYVMSALPMLLGFFVAASRVVDNAHHVGDVACGCVIGLWAACVHFYYVVGMTEGAVARDADMKKE